MERPPMETALSNDVIMDLIMSRLEVRDLLACREASKFWNKAASSVLRRRSTMIKNISETKTLKKLEKCLKQSSDFPFVGLIVDQPWKLSSARAMKFFKNYGDRFTCLRLGTSWEKRLQNQAPCINHLPRLSILELGRPSSLSPELLDSAAGLEDGRNLNLGSLRTLRIHASRLNEDVLRQVCTAASPAVRIECRRTSYRILKALKSAGKLQNLSIIEVILDAGEKDDMLRVDRLLSSESPALTKLHFKDGGCISRNGLMRLLISGQHTLNKLYLNGIYPSEFLPECPVLTKLTTLSLCIDGQPCEFVFQGQQGHKFPALKDLKIVIELHPSLTVNLSDGLFIVPSLQIIYLLGYVNKAGIEDLARSFPNVTEIRLLHAEYDFAWSWYTDPTEIWSVRAFKKLEKLVIWPYTIQSPTKICENFEKHSKKGSIYFKIFKMINMDSFLTGIPIGICENLRKQPQQNLKDCPFNEILRESPNLLQLDNLKELIVCVRLEDELDELPEEPPFMSMVSVRYALQMMPNLRAKFVYEHSYPSWLFQEEDGDKAVTVLKTAFKHAQPYVELEPCFY